MDIYLDVLPRPFDGHEAEFEDLIDLIDAAKYAAPDTPNEYTFTERGRFFGLGKKQLRFDFDAAYARCDAISLNAYDTLNAPIVGQDAAADTWVRQAFAAKDILADSADHAVQKYKGLRALDILPDCDGFPVYSPAQWDKGYDRTTFDATMLGDMFADMNDDNLASELYGPLLASELADWAIGLRTWADIFAQTNKLDHILGDRTFKPSDPDGIEAQLHIADQAARWAAFWSARGHGSEPQFDPITG